MIKKRNTAIFLAVVFIALSSCRKKEFDEYFARPDNLADPIYKELQKKSNFTQILACIDKAGYSKILGAAGYWTFFAPNDDAFREYYAAHNIAGIDGIDSLKAAGIVTYSLVTNAYRKEQLAMLQGASTSLKNAAFRRKTAYYDFAFKESNHSGVVVANNRNGSTYIANDNNNKYISYFTDGYFAGAGLSASDYNFFYPNVSFTGFNVAGARVITQDIPAENGIIHEIGNVLDPVPNIEQYVSSNPDYSEFKKLLDKVAQYTPNVNLSKRYNILTGKTDSVYLKSYPTTLAFSPNNEGYLSVNQTDGQENGWTIAVPTNSALIAWEKEILVNLGSFEAAPSSVLTDLINSFMWPTSIWPNKLLTSNNFQVQTATFGLSDVIDRKVLSNAFFYGTSVPQKANVFRTVYGKAYLNPKYSLMTRAFNQTDLKVAATNNDSKYALFMMSDKDLNTIGYSFDTDRGQWLYKDPVTGASTYSTSQDNLFRIAQTSLVKAPWGDFDNLVGEGIGEGFGGEYVKFKAGKVYASGNAVSGTPVTIDSVKMSSNGPVYYTKGLLTYADNTETLGLSIKRLAESTDPAVSANFSYFYQYLSNSAGLWIPLTYDILGAPVGTFYTAFIPSNDAIKQAVKDGLLPGDKTTGAPTFSPVSPADQATVSKFILYHLVTNNTIAADGKKSGFFPTLFKNEEGTSKLLSVYYPATSGNNVPSQMEIRDASNSVASAAKINLSYSNNLGNRALVHSINKVLNFNK